MEAKPKIYNMEETNGILKFTLENVNVSYANGIRRILLSEIPCIVITSYPYEENNITIIKNKSILITGGTGSFGKQMVKILLERYHLKKIVIYKILIQSHPGMVKINKETSKKMFKSKG